MTTIRRATLFDLATLRDFWWALVSEEAANESIHDRTMYPSVPATDMEQWTVETAVTILNSQACFLLAESAGHPCGFMLSSIQHRTVGHPKQFIHVHQLYVQPVERRAALGDAAALLQQATTDWALSVNVRSIELDCVLSNQARWAKLGFQPAAVRMYKEI